MEGRHETDLRLEALEKELAAKKRELEIEAALETIRSSSLAMHHSGEIKQVANVLYQKLKELGLRFDGGAAIILFTESSKDAVIGVIAPLTPPTFHDLPYDEEALADNPIMQDLWKAKYEGADIINKYYSFEQKNRYFEYVFKHNDESKLPQPVRQFILNANSYTATFIAEKNSLLGANSWTQQLFTEENIADLKRVAKVFDQAYIRFLDLQKAEAQAREARIEAVLEKIRSRSLAMYKSDELKDVVDIVFEKLIELKLDFDGAGIQLFTVDSKDSVLWIKGRISPTILVNHPYDEAAFNDSELLKDIWTAKEIHEPVFNKTYPFEEKNKLVEYTGKYNMANGVSPEMVEKMLDAKCYTATFIPEKNCCLWVDNWSDKKISVEDFNVAKRVAKVFEQAYIRFVDLQKAEAQAREAQIEAALERVRARAMAMGNSDELNELIGSVFTELTKLDLVLTRCVILIYEGNEKGVRWWMANSEAPSTPMNFFVRYADMPFFNEYLKAWRERSLKWQYLLEGKNKTQTDDFLFTETELSRLPGLVIEGMKAPDHVYLNASFNNFGNLTLASLEPLSDEHFNILLRFAKVFDLTYTRFNDLKQAEAQARESQIQLALERVRARTMAMQESDELREVVAALFDQIKGLGFEAYICSIVLRNKEKPGYQVIPSYQTQAVLPQTYNVPDLDDAFSHKFMQAFDEGVAYKVFELGGIDKKELDKNWFTLTDFKYVPEKLKRMMINTPRCLQCCAYMKHGCITAIGDHELSAEQSSILQRFANVFDQTYTRFLDLQKAEAQAREAEIQLALERVRARTMAMQKSEELPDAAKELFQQVQSLGISSWAAGYCLWEDDKKAVIAWMHTQGVMQPPMKYPTIEEELFIEMVKGYESGKEVHVVEMGGEGLLAHYRYMYTLPGVAKMFDGIAKAGHPLPAFQINHYAYFSKGFLMFITYDPVPEAHAIFKRFGKVFEQTYTRFLDLQKAELQAREAIKRASVDRVRAEIASMRTTSDLERITPLIWNELTTLGVPFMRCGVFIMDEQQQQIETHLSTPDGQAFATFNLSYTTPGVTAEILARWRKKELYKEHWNKTQLIEFTQNLVHQGAITTGEKNLTENHPAPADLYLHFLPFMQGMLYVGNNSQLNDDELHLMQNLADAFSTAYARYEDFNRLEAAKKQVDKTLNELQATQKQLIQSEKMASLGELTAGIAHEIQNPLNFVNNFSDLNTELVDELKKELVAGNTWQAIEVAENIKNNQEKITYHGQRADAIVKSMLQHSKISSGRQEPTDINALCDEYLRLAYHGLRAKDKSFKAKFETNFDNTIGKVNIVPQDVGRVTLNLINNAFYAVSEKAKQNIPGYEPCVAVSTRQFGDKVELCVKDNGSGIPERLRDKIFQPFFTTKPAGQGTGLGLSLAYDIIKAHGGEIRVETKEGGGSEFIIQLPVHA